MGVQERRERERLQRRMEIIDAAEKVFSNKGFENSTMDDVAAEVELSKGAIYFYFKSKAEICLSILLKSLHEIEDTFRNIIEQNQSGFLKFKTVCNSYLDFYDNHPNFLTAVTNFRSHKDHCDAESVVLQEVMETNRNITSLIQEILQSGVQDNSIISEVEPEILAKSFWGDLNGLLLSLSISDNDARMNGYEYPDRIFIYILNLLSNSIKKR